MERRNALDYLNKKTGIYTYINNSNVRNII